MSENKITQQDLELAYDLYFDKIYKFFYYKVLSRETAEDLTSDTFIAFADALKAKKEVENIKAFLYGIAKNTFLRHLKQKYRREIPFSNIADDFYEYADNFVENVESKKNFEDILLKFIDKIPEKQSKVLHMRLIEKMSLKEICDKLKKDMNYVKTTQKRGIKSLKELVATKIEGNN